MSFPTNVEFLVRGELVFYVTTKREEVNELKSH